MSAEPSLLREPLSAAAPSIPYVLSEAIARAWPEHFVLETSDYSFGIQTFLARRDCEVTVHTTPHAQIETHWLGPDDGLQQLVVQGHRTVIWEGEAIEVVTAEWVHNSHQQRLFFVGRTADIVERFAIEVAEVANEVVGEVLVFANGCWQRSKPLRTAITGSTFENLILGGGLADEIRGDFEHFLGSREVYAQYGVPWKRGVLFLGPPGNGKTHCVKALLNALDLPCLYVQSFEAQYSSPQANVHQVFERARRTTPCALVLEDLDALVTEATRSFFLNELDGFASNAGIVTIATTNHAERLDPAILDRPSRFDRKYHFDLPGESERMRYLILFNNNLEEAARLADSDLGAIASSTEGFSYAYVKELMLSSLMRWMAEDRKTELVAVARGQVDALRQQMRSNPSASADAQYVVPMPVYD